MEQFIQNLAIWSYVAVFVLMWLENAGLPLPAQTIALVMSALAGQGQLNVLLVWVCVFAGGLLGYSTGYWLGLAGGRRLIERYGRYLFITPKRFATAEKLFQEHGSKAVFFGRYMPFLCMWAGNLAGITRLSLRRFLIANLAGTLFWATTQTGLGYIFGRSWELLIQTTNNVGLVLLAFFAVGGIAVWRKRRRAKAALPHKLETKAVEVDITVD